MASLFHCPMVMTVPLIGVSYCNILRCIYSTGFKLGMLLMVYIAATRAWPEHHR